MRNARMVLGRGASAVVVSSLVLLALAEASQDVGQTAAAAAGVVGNRSTKAYHFPSCELARRLPGRSKVAFADASAAAQAGFRPCPTCKPGEDRPDPSDAAAAKPEPRNSPARKGGRPRRGGAAGDGALSFSRDIAPILVGNCTGCHNGEQKRGGLDMTSFQGLQQGSESGPVIVPGNPTESLFVQMVEARKMPRGGNRRLSDEAIAKLRRWVEEGALLDSSDPAAPLDRLAPSSEELRRELLASLTPEELAERAKSTGLERIKQAAPAARPTATMGRSFIVIGELPEARARRLLRVLEGQTPGLVNLLGDAAPVLSGPEPIGVYVLKDMNGYTEFVRGVERREPELGAMGHARLTVENPYLVAVDPLAGGDEPAVPRGRASRKRQADDSSLDVPERTLAGIAAEALASGAVLSGGKAPRWLAEGLGVLAAAQEEPGSPYVAKLRSTAVQQLQLGGPTRATEVLGDQGAPETIRSLGYSLCDCLASTARPQFAPFVRILATEGGAKLDEAITNCFGPEATRDLFIQQWGGYVAEQYAARRR